MARVVTPSKKTPLSAVRIVRALKATKYEVEPEKKGGAAGETPVSLLPKGSGQDDEPVTQQGPAVTSTE